MKKFNIISPKFAFALLALFALTCTNPAKTVPVIAGGTSEETNTIAYNEVSPAVGRDGHSKTALFFKTPNSFVASDGGKFSASVAFEISAWFKIDSLPQKSANPYNLIGKNDIFSLALVNGACGAENPSFAFFLTEETSIFACGHAVLSKKPIKTGSWTFVEVKWDGRYLTLHQDGVQVAKEERILAVLPYSNVPIYLGKSGITFAIDELSLNTEAL
jgi:hypothetical protein